MNCKVEKTKNANEIKLEITVESTRFDEAIKKVYFKSAKYFNIPGFRKGKAPMQIVEKYYGKEIFYEDAFNEVAQEALEEAIKENKLEVVSRPDIEVTQIEKGKDLIFTAVMQTKPEANLGKYKGIEIKKIEYNVSDKDIEHELGHMQEHNARLISIEDRPVETGDIATIDFEGFVDGKAFEGGKAEGHELEIGSNTFIPGFEDQVIGMNIDEEKEIKVKFPDEYFSKDLAGKEAMFKVKVHEIKKKELPELDDEFAKDVSEFDTLKELKADIKSKQEKQNEEKAKYYISLNFLSNFLGLSHASTSSGLLAFQELDRLNGHSTAASKAMCTFLIMNISSLQLIPVNIIAYRSQYHSTSPAAVTGPCFAATMVSTLAAVMFCKIMDHLRNPT